MATKELLLLQPVEKLGNEGDHVTVKAGFARNFLVPRKMAVPFTKANRKQIEALRKAREKRQAKELDAAQRMGERLETLGVAIAVKTGPGGKLFGSVTVQNLIDRLTAEGVELDRKQVQLHSPIKSLGKHETRIRLHEEVAIDFSFEVVSENPIEETEGEGDASED